MKKGREIEVIEIVPIVFHWYTASYSCSAAAKVLRYLVTISLSTVMLRIDKVSPWVSIVVRVLRISANSNTRTLGNTLVDVIDRAERVSHNLVVRKSLVTAWLESGRIARCSRIKHVDAGQDRVCVLARSSTTSVGKCIRASPVRLEKAQDKRSLGNTIGARLAKLASEAATLDECTILNSCREEGRRVDFLPQVEACLVPILSDVREIILNNWPDDRVDGRSVSVGLYNDGYMLPVMLGTFYLR
jgi:hypothetical protein